MPRLRQVVLAARELERAVTALRTALAMGAASRTACSEPFRDPAVAHFGLVNAVFALGDTFLEVVSPVDLSKPGARTAAAQLERCGTDVCGYMAMVQVEDLPAARERAAAAGVREVFAVALPDIAEVHLHPADMRGAIVALSQPKPPSAWRWGGSHWRDRATPGGVLGATVSAAGAGAVAAVWERVAGGPIPGCRFIEPREAAPARERVTARGGPRRAAESIVEIELEVSGVTRRVVPHELA